MATSIPPDSETDRYTAQILQLQEENQRLRDQIDEMANSAARQSIAAAQLTEQLRDEIGQLRTNPDRADEIVSNAIYPSSIVASRTQPGMVTFFMHGAPSFSVNARCARDKIAKATLHEADVADRLRSEYLAKVRAEQATAAKTEVA